jgi:hypothetical protein
MALVYLVNKPQVSSRITRWLLLFLEYDFKIVYKPSISHLMANTLSRLPNQVEPIGVLDQTTKLICSPYSQSGYRVFIII